MAFNNLIGNDKIKSLLQKAIENNNILHTYMFLGVDGIGKFLFAKEFAKMILCSDANNKPCNKCVSCIQFDSNNNPDFTIIEPDGKVIKIEQIRLMQEKILEKPIGGSKKIYIIRDADKMTKESQNCLLKTLEEPPEYVVMILLVQNEGQILNTVKSRCLRISFEKISDIELKDYILKNNILDNIDENMLKLCEGSIGKAINLKENEILYRSLIDILENLDKLDLVEILKKAEIIYKEKENILELLDYFNVIIYNIYTKRLNDKYLNCILLVEEAKKRIRFNTNFDMTLDNLLITMWEELNN